MPQTVDELVKGHMQTQLLALEKELQSDCLFFFGAFQPGLEIGFRTVVEKLKQDEIQNERLTIILTTPGGSVETVEKLVRITRYHYKYVEFIVPNSAMSAGTIFCMSGDRILMDYSSSLGPIDPQITLNNKDYLPARGYLDKVEELIEKSRVGTLTEAEFLLLKELDFSFLETCKQASELSVTLLKKWLVEYKFKDWANHTSTGNPVTTEEKRDRAEEIAKALGDHKIWRSHGLGIGIQTLQNDLRLLIDDYSDDFNLRSIIREYNDVAIDYISKMQFSVFLHSRNFI